MNMGGISKLFNVSDIRLTQIRTLIKKPPLPEEGGIKYNGFVYYPRHPDFKDPPYEPTKLFLVTRLGKMSGLNPVERRNMELLKINGKARFNEHRAIVKNIPEINAMLWRVKHLVQIKPIKFVNGLPKDGDFTGTYLRDNGEFIVSKKVKVDSSRIKATENFVNDTRKMDTKYMRNYLKLRWECAFTADM